MKTPPFDHSHPLWDTFVAFHTGQLSGAARSNAKSLLFPIHYGSHDMERAWNLINVKRAEMSLPAFEMHIKIVPKAEPNSTGRWITVPLRSHRFFKFAETIKLYEKDIPNDHFAVSFDRFGDISKRLGRDDE